jgi:hypothetical protein
MEPVPPPVTADRTTVSADYQMFGLHDPTCEEIQNFDIAIRAASADIVGWADNAMMINVVSDLARIEVGIEVLDGAPPAEDSADLVREGELALPGGRVSIPQSVDERFLRGVDLAPGPGTYRVRICGYGRTRAREIWDHGAAQGPGAVPPTVEALRGVERYRISLWQVATEPRWPDDDEDDG